MKATSFSPKSFLKTRRPERFSDTVFEEATVLDRSLLEFHLSSLTSRSQETDFERFARQLCENEICPNLLPQTGPTGGGDSKVDSETYPVADTLSFTWYIGTGREAASERWAFAFSAKADWRSKLKSDVDKIVGTKRGYTKAFFVSNQAVPDRKRAEVEDALRVKKGIDVRILDRTWILDRVFKGGHEKLAINELGVTGLSRREVKKGPLDVKREKELKGLEKRIREAIKTKRLGAALVEDALQAADLARNLERPRTDVEGRYVRADQLALKCGTPRQQAEAAYQWAWTLFWWFEDYGTFSEKYSVVEERTSGSLNAYDLEQLCALWITLHGAIVSGALDAESTDYDTHTARLTAELARLKGEKDRPSTSLLAETLLHKVNLMSRLYAKEPIDEILRALQSVVLRSEGLIGFPLEPLVEALTEIGQVLDGFATYNELFETIIKVASTRDGEVSAARLLLTRGERQLLQDRPFEAIATLGRALAALYKNETRHDSVKALYLCGCAYEKVGLCWAARGTLLAAASVATDEFWRYGDVTPYQAACYRQLKWVELRLGRLPHFLAWHELDMVIRNELVARGYPNELLADEPAFNAALIRLLLRTDFFDLKAVQKLPDVLDALELDFGADALLYALGHTERMDELASKFDEDITVFAEKWRNLKADVRLPERPALYYQQRVSLESRLLGCRILVKSETNAPCVEVAESMLAALESFLATSALDRAIAHEPELTVEIRKSDFADEPVGVSVEERAGRPHLVVRCRPFDPHDLPLDEQAKVREAVFQLTIRALSHFVTFKDFRRDLEALFRDERVAERAVAFTSTFGTQTSVLGASPKTRLSDWTNKEASTYPLRREEPWESRAITNGDKQEDDSLLPRVMEGVEPPPEILNPNLRSHDQIMMVSLIRDGLWDRAEWSGVAFLVDPTHRSLPVFAICFRNQEAGLAIFKFWRKELGDVDSQEQLGLWVIRGIDRLHPHAYRVILGSNPNKFPKDAQFTNFAYRFRRMDATTSDNIDRFLKARDTFGRFILAPAFVQADFDGSQAPDFGLKLSIGMSCLHVRQAWEIGPHQIEAVAILDDDDPVIPDNIEDAPVLELLRNQRSG